MYCFRKEVDDMNLTPWRNKQKENEAEHVPVRRQIGECRSEMDRLFDWFTNDVGAPWGDFFTPAGAWTPVFDVTETEK